MSGVVESFHETEPFGPTLMAMIVSTKNSAPVGVRDQYLYARWTCFTVGEGWEYNEI